MGPDHAFTQPARRRRRISPDAADVWEHADLDEVRKECRAQIERAIYWGFDVSHLDSHMGTMQLRADFFDVYLELAVEFGLPLRMAGASGERVIGFPYRRVAAEEGVVFPDHFVYTHVGSRRMLERTSCSTCAPASPRCTCILRSTPTSCGSRTRTGRSGSRTTRYVTSDASLRDLIDRSGAILIGYRELRDLQRGATVHGVTHHPGRARRALRGRDAGGAAHGRRAAARVLRCGRRSARRRRRRGRVHDQAAWRARVRVDPAGRRPARASRVTVGAGSCSTRRSNGHVPAARHRVHLANAVPRYLWPGVDVDEYGGGWLFETRGLRARPRRHQHDDPVDVPSRTPAGRRRRARDRRRRRRVRGPGVSALGRRARQSRSTRGAAFAARTADGETIGFGCHSCNRAAWIGPMATDPDRTTRRRRLRRARGGVRRPRGSRPCGRRDRVGLATCASTASAARPCRRVFQGGHRALVTELHEAATGRRARRGSAPAVSGRNRSNAPKSPAILIWPRMNPTERSSAPVAQRVGVGGRDREHDVGGSWAPALRPCPTTRSSSSVRVAAGLFLLALATTNSTSIASDRRARVPDTGEEVVLVLAVALAGVDERAGEHELLPREDLAHDVVGKPHPEAVRVDLGAVREQRLAPLVQVVAHVDRAS